MSGIVAFREVTGLMLSPATPPKVSDVIYPCLCHYLPLSPVAQGVLAFVTGATAGLAGTFVVARSVWMCAQAQGTSADATVSKLHGLHGVRDDTTPRQVRHTALFADSCAEAFVSLTHAANVGAEPTRLAAATRSVQCVECKCCQLVRGRVPVAVTHERRRETTSCY